MLRGAVIGTGFWSHYQVSAWKELDGVEFVAASNRTLSKAKLFAEKFNIPAVYDNVEEMLDRENIDFVDIISDAATHLPFTKLAAEKKIHVVCQKPMSESLHHAREMLNVCNASGVKLFIHENFRWQAPIRSLKEKINSGIIGKVFKARVQFCSAFPVFDNQPFLKEVDHFILTDIGSHILDVCRFLFGEAKNVYCITRRINPGIKGEDVACVFMDMENGVSCFADMSYASILEKESFPQTFALIEGDKGSIQLTHNFELRTTTSAGTNVETAPPLLYDWIDPAYAVVHSSIVDCNRNILAGLNDGECETSGADNFETVKLVWAAYRSAASGKTIYL